MKSETEVLIEALDQGYNYFKNVLKEGLEANNRYREEKDFSEGFFDYLLKHKDELKFGWYRVLAPHFRSEETGKEFICKSNSVLMSNKKVDDKLFTDDMIYGEIVSYLNHREDVIYHIYSITKVDSPTIDINNLDNPMIYTDYSMRYAVEQKGELMSSEEYYNAKAKDFEIKAHTESFFKYLVRQKHKVKFNWKAVKSINGFDKETRSVYCIKSRYVYQGNMFEHSIEKIYDKIIEDLNNENGSMFFIYALQIIPVLIEPEYTKVDKSKIRFLLRYAKQVLVPGEDYDV